MKKLYFVFGILTLMIIAPYLWLILDILDKQPYDRLLLDACVSGPCMIFIGDMWAFVKKVKRNESQKENNND